MRVAFLVSSGTPDAERPPSRGRASYALALLLVALAMLLFASALSPTKAADTISAIEITGDRTVGADAVRSHLKLAQGSPYDAAKADQSIKALFATGLFAHVSIERRGTSVVV